MPAFIADHSIDPIRAYDLSKEAVIVWTKANTERLFALGLRANTVSPAAVDTGILADFGTAFAKSQTAAYGSLPLSGAVFVSVANKDKRSLIFPVKRLADLGFTILATDGTAEVLRRNGIACEKVYKQSGEEVPAGESTIVDKILAGDIAMVINTPYGNSGPRVDGYEIRSAAVAQNIPCITTVQGASAAVQGIEAAIAGDIGVRSLQDLHAALADQSKQQSSAPRT